MQGGEKQYLLFNYFSGQLADCLQERQLYQTGRVVFIYTDHRKILEKEIKIMRPVANKRLHQDLREGLKKLKLSLALYFE
jgi:hypothetical protein